MATLVLSAVGASLGAGFGGTVLGLSGAVIGRAVGATLGRVIDQRVMGSGSDAVEVGRVERFTLMGASEGAPLTRVWGRMRVAGQVIWATRFQENVTRSGGGKGAPQPRSDQFSYSLSLAIALCEGQITSLGRVWADGNEIAKSSLTLRVYPGDEAQLPDPKIAAVEGAGAAPSYRGVAYVVIEDLDLSRFGNRVPQFSFEVLRAAQGPAAAAAPPLSTTIPGVCLIPGTGEYALATTPVHYDYGPGVSQSANVHSAGEATDFTVSLQQLAEEVPGAGAVSLVVSWFGDDLRCGQCSLRPKVEQTTHDGVGMPWRAGGITRGSAQPVPQLEGRPVYGGTPADRSVIEAIAALNAKGKDVTFYPFLLMDQLSPNTRPDPWSDATSQPALPWRGRITLSQAPGRAGSPDRTAAAAAEVAAFFGAATPAHFNVASGNITYSGPADWGYRRFILHYATLCALAGGVEAFCIGSEMRSLTQIRGVGDSFPAVTALKALAQDVRQILGPNVKISYAADWSEYFGHHVDDNVYFHLDPLWSDPAIDFIGIDNYMPVADWRDGLAHADATWPAIHDLGYLTANIAGGEGFDWYYDGPEGEAAQRRKPIEDAEHQEPWVYRYKDLRGWWSNPHHDRIGGVRAAVPSGWVPGSKPFRFTEFGCAAVDKGANQPNRFLDLKSSESGLPKYSSGRRDDLMQMAYHHAIHAFWTDPANNPVALTYAGTMLDFAHSTAWAWDARPFPAFPATESLWSDGANYDTGHWLNGRTANQTLAAVIGDLCAASGLPDPDLSQAHGLVRGYALREVGAARAALQPLLLAEGVDAVERAGRLRFVKRRAGAVTPVDPAGLALAEDLDGSLELTRSGLFDRQDRLRLSFPEAEGDFSIRTVDAVSPDAVTDAVSDAEMPLLLTRAEAVSMAERWLAEARVARDGARFALPPSLTRIGAGDVIALQGKTYRIDRIEQSSLQIAEAVRVEAAIYQPAEVARQPRNATAYQAPLPVFAQFLDLPLLTGTEIAHAPHIAVAAKPWPGTIGLWSSVSDDGYTLNTRADQPAVIGRTLTALAAAAPGRWDRGPALEISVETGSLSSASALSVFAGANALAIGDGSSGQWEVLQFTDAALIAPKTYALSNRLRGQLGTDGVQPTEWPAGSVVVLLDSALRQIDLPLSARGLERYYRIAPLDRGYQANDAVQQIAAFDGVGLRPYPVCHLRAKGQPGAEITLSWVRRTRIDGDSWQSVEVPLGEDSESYRVRVLAGATVLREHLVSSPNWAYTLAMQAADTASGTLSVEVAQLSQRFGPGPARVLIL